MRGLSGAAEPRLPLDLLRGNRNRFEMLHLAGLYRAPLKGAAEEAPGVQLPRATLAVSRRAGIQALVYVVPVNVVHLATMGLDGEAGFTRTKAVCARGSGPKGEKNLRATIRLGMSPTQNAHAPPLLGAQGNCALSTRSTPRPHSIQKPSPATWSCRSAARKAVNGSCVIGNDGPREAENASNAHMRVLG